METQRPAEPTQWAVVAIPPSGGGGMVCECFPTEAEAEADCERRQARMPRWTFTVCVVVEDE